ncbi:ATP-grasp domain-containing protein [Priestia megaterium]|uniref:ATP-grasp domain-containing protein n=1 Tax=Priestia megaterium TaxID=1404 RepID=UPI001596E430|nr:ATP-grasp domain-containing protein [Priestia megaterium]
MKKIMILGASILQLPAILKAKEMGVYVIGIDMDENAVGFQYCDDYYVISTTDIQGVTKVAKNHKIDGILTIASDMPVRTVAAVSKELDIPGLDDQTALRATDKFIMREALKSHNVPVPYFAKASDINEYLQVLKKFKGCCIVKPVDCSGSRGVCLIENLTDIQEIKKAFEYSKKNSKSGEIIIEEYMEGEEVSVEILSTQSECHIIAITDKITTGAPYFVELGHSQPTQHSYTHEIKKIAVEAVKAIGIKEGPAHVEIKITKQGPKIVEVGARLGGDNITTHLTPLSTGVDMVKACIEISLGIIPDLKRKKDQGAAVRYLEADKGVLTSLRGVKEALELPGVEQVSIVKKIGSEINPIQNSADRIGFCISKGSNAMEAIKNCEMATRLIEIGVLKGE